MLFKLYHRAQEVPLQVPNYTRNYITRCNKSHYLCQESPLTYETEEVSNGMRHPCCWVDIFSLFLWKIVWLFLRECNWSKPLEQIFYLSFPPLLHIGHWLLKLQEYVYKIIYDIEIWCPLSNSLLIMALYSLLKSMPLLFLYSGKKEKKETLYFF